MDNRPKNTAVEDNAPKDIDIDNPPRVDHNWIDRGLKLSCEGSGHPNHWVYKKPGKS